MGRPSLRAVFVACGLSVGATLLWVASLRSAARVIEAGFWFEDVTYQGSDLGPSLTADERALIEAHALTEIRHAFAPWRIVFSDRRDTRFGVRVVQTLRDQRFGHPVEIAGASGGMAGLGGRGAVSFNLLAATAVGYAPLGADRPAILAAIGRGIGVAAVHEFAHLLLPKASLHSADASTYEYYSAQRREQVYGRLHWATAWPLLQKRLRPAGG